MARNLLTDVGDGLCLTLGWCPYGVAQVDCGSQQGGRIAAEKWKQSLILYPARYDLVQSIWLTHFHTDHYNGFAWAAYQRHFPRMPMLQHAYTPRLPDPPVTAPLAEALLAFAAYTLGRDTGIMDVDFRRVAGRLASRATPIVHRSLSQGDVVSICPHVQAQIAWPPRSLPAEARAPIRSAVAEFERLLGAPSRHRLKMLYDEARAQRAASGDGDGEPVRDEASEKDFLRDVYDTPDMREDEDLRKVNDKLRSAANYLGLAFSLGPALLCLGDLEPSSVKGAVSHLASTFGWLNFRTVVAPHHGTVWCDDLYRVRARDTLVSVGETLWRHVRPELGRISRSVKFTRLHGDLRF